MNILDKKFKYNHSSQHNDPTYLHRRFAEIAGPDWNKPKRQQQPATPVVDIRRKK